MAERVWQFVVEVPVKAGEEVADAIFHAISEAVDRAEPQERDGWDCFIYGTQTDTPDDSEIARELGLTDA